MASDSESIVRQSHITGHSCPFLGCLEFFDFRKDFGKPIDEALQRASGGGVRESTAVHLDNVLRGEQRLDKSSKSLAGGWRRIFLGGITCSECERANSNSRWQVGESDVEVDHGHLGGGMAEHLHQCREVHTAAKHFGSIGVTELMRDNASGKAGSGTDLVQVRAELADERVSRSRPRQQTMILR